MDGQTRCVLKVARKLARMLEDWPEMTREDAEALFGRYHWAYKEMRYDELSACNEPRTRPRRLSHDDLGKVWELAREVCVGSGAWR